VTIDEPRVLRSVVVVLFDRFELLDVFGPLELFGVLPDRFEILLLGEKARPVRSAQGPIVLADHSYGDAPRPDVVLVPGGIGTRTLVQDRSVSAWLAGWALQAELVTSICTGSGVLAAAGLLDGYRATSNKINGHSTGRGPRGRGWAGSPKPAGWKIAIVGPRQVWRPAWT
jgi:putative intracellular protease/amidase